jgi:hypothetical protein
LQAKVLYPSPPRDGHHALVLTDRGDLSPVERVFALFTRIRPGEGRALLLFFCSAFLFLFSYYILKALREGFLLSEFPAEMRAYALAAIALLLMVIVPLYGLVRRRMDGARLLRAVSVFFAVNIVIFDVAAVRHASADIHRRVSRGARGRAHGQGRRERRRRTGGLDLVPCSHRVDGWLISGDSARRSPRATHRGARGVP